MDHDTPQLPTPPTTQLSSHTSSDHAQRPFQSDVLDVERSRASSRRTHRSSHSATSPTRRRLPASDGAFHVSTFQVDIPRPSSVASRVAQRVQCIPAAHSGTFNVFNGTEHTASASGSGDFRGSFGVFDAAMRPLRIASQPSYTRQHSEQHTNLRENEQLRTPQSTPARHSVTHRPGSPGRLISGNNTQGTIGDNEMGEGCHGNQRDPIRGALQAARRENEHRLREIEQPLARRPYREPRSRHDLGPMDAICDHCGALHWLSERLSNSSMRSPKFGTCCKHGEVRLEPYPEPPRALRELYVGDGPMASSFRENIRQYNAALAFTSLGVDIDESVNDGRGPYVFKVHGELYHRSGSLLPRTDDSQPTYAQLYFYDPREALRHRMHRNSNLRQDVMHLLQTMLTAHHQYAAIYKHAFQVMQESNVDELRLSLIVDPVQDQRRYNLPSADDVAVVLPDGREADHSRDIILRRHSGFLTRIYETNPAYAPLHYVLLFPFGTHGWTYHLRLHQPHRDKPKALSITRYYAHRFHPRRNEFSTILHGGRLFQQLAVDVWATSEQQRLRFLRANQSKLRAHLYSGLMDAISHGGDVDLNNLGCRYVLPSSHIGSPRYMQQLFQDAMAIVRYFKKIDLFITMTANPNWPEITRELLPHQTASDRPDLVARVFRQKLEQLLHDIHKKEIFGPVDAVIYRIEFQKRGLPHAHILICLRRGFRINEPVDVDSIIWARWPDPTSQPLLFESVKRNMVHGPCDARCLENGVCKKGFPKPFSDATRMDREGYPEYYRPDNGVEYEVRGKMTNCQWIVPYNPYLTSKFDCHINVETAVSFATVKYLAKYIYKGGDRASVQVDREDEISWYLNARYIAGAESLWRIFHYPIAFLDPNVVRLQVHLPGHHLVTYNPEEDPAVIMHRAANERTMLTEFFKANANDLSESSHVPPIRARNYTYQEFPQHFVWDDKSWHVRQQGNAIGRMYFVSPTAGERFYLRTLLSVVKGPTSFEHLRTVNGRLLPSYHEACIAYGLLEDDGEWRLCLQEATVMQTGARLRHLFATMLMFCRLSDPGALWRDFRQHICDDLPHRLRTMGHNNPSDDDVFDYGLYLLESILHESSQSLSNFPGMPLPQQDWTLRTNNPLITEQMSYDRDTELAAAASFADRLNADQRAAFNEIIHSVFNNQGRIFFLNGPGGTGKTFVYQTLCHKIRGEGRIALCVASSGIAALLLPGGGTSHSVFKIPIDHLGEGSFCSISKESIRAELLRHVDIIIWDEAGAQHRWCAEAVDRTCRDLRDDPRPFGGITVVFGGDFQQTLPVVPRGSREQIVEATIQHSALWRDVEVLHLRQNMRVAGDPDAGDFAQWLLDVGHGRLSDSDSRIELPDSMLCDDTPSLIDAIYHSISPDSQIPGPNYFLDRAILAPRNDEVNALNSEVLARFRGQEMMFFSADSIDVENGADGDIPDQPDYPLEFLRSLSPPGIPLGELRLKKGCPIIVLRNLSPGRGLCNGTRAIVTRMSQRVLEVKVIGGDHHGETAFIPRIVMTTSTRDGELSFVLRRRQYPVRLAFAMTINKSQGQSLKIVGLDLRSSVFSHGQLYVALSRATSKTGIKVLLPDDRMDNTTLNVVYPEVLLD